MKRFSLNPFQMAVSFRSRAIQPSGRDLNPNSATGKDFTITIRRKDEYTLGGNFDFAVDKFFDIMTPNSFSWRGLTMDSRQWNVEVGADRIHYQWDRTGIHLHFNEEINLNKALTIAEEITQNLETYTGHRALMEVCPKTSQNTYYPNRSFF